MANNHDQFVAFNDTIELTKTKKDTLNGNRKALRSTIKKYFDDNKPNEIKPKFRSQGSFVMKTTVNPIARKSNDGKKDLYNYDIDDGVYFVGDEEVKDRKSIDTYHNWIYDAVKDHTGEGAEKRNTCVRVLYADGHHIDLPIYYKLNKDNSIPELAHKSKGWIDSDPKEFYEWFNDRASNQLRRIVRYLKAWCDYRNFKNSSVKMPSGFIMTILATENISYDTRDDIAFKNTLENIQKKIDKDHGGKFECKRPTTPKGEDLFSDFSDTRKDNFLSHLDSFINSAQQAINGKNQKESCLKWQKHFGDRFSCSTAKDEDEQSAAKSYSAPAVIASNAKSA
jgi:hypothetical protein